MLTTPTQADGRNGVRGRTRPSTMTADPALPQEAHAVQHTSTTEADAEESRIKPLVIRSALVASLGGLVFGFDTAVISGTTEQLQSYFGLSDARLGWVVGIAVLGTILGAMTAGRPADRFGRKKVLAAIGILYVVGSLGSAFATNILMLEIFRFIGGIGVGVASVCAPIYTAEISPARIRGRLVGLVQFNIVLGILLAYMSNAIVRVTVANSATDWRWMFGIMAVPALVFLILLTSVPETPRWLLANGRETEAIQVIDRITTSRDEARAQVDEIRTSLADQVALDGQKVPFFARQNLKVILMAFAIAMFNQMSGINAVLYYAPVVMVRAGATTDSAFIMSVGVGLMNLIATMAALTVIDRLGRRKLMLIGSIGYLVSLGSLSAFMFYYENVRAGQFDTSSSYVVLVLLMVFIASHAFGQGSVIWVFISEIFPNPIRGRGQSFGSLTHWVFAWIASTFFPGVIGAFGGGIAFGIFALFMLGQLIWVLKVMPETKGVPLEEMEERLGLSHSPTARPQHDKEA